ncbi:MAG: copper chaperone PCu(A)C [Ottowia sp.]|uniref:copper chaperone PCu(A)C n=1 Tax=unclassified Ottowia TaxID=2645081 RepID=UPI003C2E78C1
MRSLKTSLAAFVLMAVSAAAFAQAVKIDNAWVRASVAGQKATGAFMTLTAKEGTRLVGVATPSAGVAEIHEMAMQGDVMKMRSVSELDLPAGKAVELKPGGFHVMLLDLKAPLAADSTVPLTLTFKDAKGAESKTELTVPVRAVNASAHGGHGHKH